VSIHIDPHANGEHIDVPVFPNPDVMQLKRFADAAFRHADGGWLLLRAFEHKLANGEERSLWGANVSIHTGDPQFIHVVAERARQAASWPKSAVFCPPTATFKTGENAKAENVLNGLVLSDECDQAPNAARATLTKLLGEPTLVIASGGEWTNPTTGEIEPKLHLHWRLREPTKIAEDHKRLKEARALVVLLTGGDPTNITLVHPIRWPGSWHTKNKDNPRLATIVSECDSEIDLSEALEVLEEAAGAEQYNRSSSSKGGGRARSGLGGLSKLARDIKHVEMALNVIPNDDLHWAEWNNRIGLAVWGATGGSEECRDSFARWSAKSNKNDPAATNARWDGMRKSPPNRAGMGTLWYLAEKHQPGSMTGKPVIRIVPHDIPAIAQLAEETLLKDERTEFYQRGGALVRPVMEDVDASHGRRTLVARLVGITSIYLRNELDKVAAWMRFSSKQNKDVRIGAPLDIANVILSQVGNWTFPRIAGIIAAPTVRPDGSLLLQEGYDEATRLLLVAPPKMPPTPEHPTKDAALAALKLLEGLLAEFPFVEGGVAKAVALSCLITPVVRGAFPTAPMYAILAHAAGSGKSYLADIAATISSGKSMPVMSAAGSEDELEKRLVAAIISGQSMLSMDNVNGQLRSDLLCQILTQQTVDVRILGRSEQVSVETRGLTCFATGNNLQVCSDLTRRTIVCSLDPKMEQPELRKFDKSPTSLVLADRGKYVAACLTIVRAYITAGMPDKKSPLASFEGWSDTVRSALVWLGQKDPVDSLALAHEEDPDRIQRETVMLGWKDAIGSGADNKKTVTQLITTADSILQQGVFAHTEFRDAIVAASGRKGGMGIDPAGLGYWLRINRGKVVNGMRIMNKATAGHPARWWLEDMSPKQAGS
jgi:hypothetical protein